MAIYAEQLTKLDDLFATFALNYSEEWNVGIIKILNDQNAILAIPVVIAIIAYYIILLSLNIFRKMKKLN